MIKNQSNQTYGAEAEFVDMVVVVIGEAITVAIVVDQVTI